MNTYGKYGERLLTQERFNFILNAVRTYLETHSEYDSNVIHDMPMPFVEYMADKGIDEEELELSVYDVSYALDHDLK